LSRRSGQIIDFTLHYSYLEWPKYKTAKPLLYTRCTELIAENSYEKMIWKLKKGKSLRRFRKTVSIEAWTWTWGASI